MVATKRIAVLLPNTISSAFLNGWGSYVRDNKLHWEALPQTPQITGHNLAKSLKRLRCDGIVGQFQTQEDIHHLRKLNVPIVSVADIEENAGLPRVLVDHRAVGVLAATHLMNRGFMRVGCFVLTGHWYATVRYEGFITHARGRGRECFELHRPDGFMPFEQLSKLIGKWLDQMQLPMGVFATNDERSRELLEVCQHRGLRVPEDVAIVGAGNQQVLCELSSPPLSSVDWDDYEIGLSTARLLDDLICGRCAPDVGDVLVSPRSVITRQSSDAVALDNERIAKAVRFMHDKFSKPINISEVLTHGGISRRFLETEMKRHFDKTPLQYLYELRLEMARYLLRTRPHMKLKEVADACGFLDGERMNAVFRRYTGKVARQFRSKRKPDDQY